MTSTDDLDILFPWPADAPRHVIVTGLNLTGVVPGRLHGRFPAWRATGTGSSNYEIGAMPSTPCDIRNHHLAL